MVLDLMGRGIRFFWQIIRKTIGVNALITITLLHLIFVIVSFGLGSFMHSLDDAQSSLMWISIIGLLTGWQISATTKKSLPIYLMAIVIGVPFVFLTIGQLWDKAFDYGRVLLYHIRYIARISLRPSLNLGLPPTINLELTVLSLIQTAVLYLNSIERWLINFIFRKPAFNAEAVNFVWALLLWLFALWSSGYLQKTGRVLLGILPAAVILAAGLGYTRSQRPGSLILLLFFYLILTAYQSQRSNENRWGKLRLDFAEDIRLDFSFVSTLVIFSIIAFTYLVSIFNPRQIIRDFFGVTGGAAVPVEDSENIDFGESFGLSRPTQPPAFFERIQNTGLPRSHLIDAGPEAEFDVVMTIQVQDPVDQPNHSYYWRSLTYDVYNGRGWSTGETRSINYQRGTILPLKPHPYTRIIRQQISEVKPRGQIVYAAGDVISIDQNFEVAWHPPVSEAQDVFGVRQRGENYIADSQYPLLLPDQLRIASTDYPTWVINRYLEIPETMPARVLDLAFELTQNTDNPYEKAQAIESYLRGFPYTLELSSPPQDLDIVDYFLFELQKGYCDYYASSMVVMARAIGLPARLAVGFSSGTYDEANQRFVITEINAHSWPELYFPDFGWVPFEPTAGLGELQALEETSLPTSANSPFPPLAENFKTTTAIFFQWISFIILGGIFCLSIWSIFDLQYLKQLSPPDFFTFVFHRLYAFSRQIQVPSPQQATPNEEALALLHYLTPLFEKSRVLKNLPGHQSEIIEFAKNYNASVYSRSEPDLAAKLNGIKSWRRLRVKLLWLRLKHWINKGKGSFTKIPK